MILGRSAERQPEILEELDTKRRIGKTRHSKLYLAHINGDAEKPVVYKIANGSGQGLAALRNEVRELPLLQDIEGVIPLISYGKGENGSRPFLITPYIAAGNLLDRPVPKKSADILRTWEILRGISSTLASMHDRNKAHRDIKPSNMLADDDDASYLIDFGLASYRFRRPDGNVWGGAEGSLDYASPERLKGSMILLASDVFSYGVSTLELLTGQHPYIKPGEDPRMIGTDGMIERIGSLPLLDKNALSQLPPELSEHALACVDPHWQNRPPMSSSLSLA